MGLPNDAAKGPEGDWDAKFAGVCNLIPVADELYLYYSGANIPHNIKGEDGKKKTVADWPGKTIAGQHRADAVGLLRRRLLRPAAARIDTGG